MNGDFTVGTSIQNQWKFEGGVFGGFQCAHVDGEVNVGHYTWRLILAALKAHSSYE